MKMNKFLIVGAIAAMSLSSAYAQEAPNNNQQEINPTVQKTLNTVGGFFGSLVQSEASVILLIVKCGIFASCKKK